MLSVSARLPEVRVSGPAPAQRVWERYMDPQLWPTWAPHIRAVRSSTPTIRVGTTGVVTAVGGLRARFRVTDVDPDRLRWFWTVRALGVRLDLDHAVAPARDGAGSMTTLGVRGLLPVVVPYLPVARWALRRLVSS